MTRNESILAIADQINIAAANAFANGDKTSARALLALLDNEAMELEVTPAKKNKINFANVVDRNFDAYEKIMVRDELATMDF